MRVNYKGQDTEYDYRIAEINFYENEFHKVERIAFAMKIKGWNIELVTDGYALCEVADKKDYQCFMKEWKEVKRVITNCEKFGF